MSTEKWNTIERLDLRSVKDRFLKRKGRWWAWRFDVDEIEREYRRLLYLTAINPRSTIVPWSRDLDDFWREHVLDTRKYADDCERSLGRFAHHRPHASNDDPAQRRAIEETRRLYQRVFGDPPGGAARDSGATHDAPGRSRYGGLAVDPADGEEFGGSRDHGSHDGSDFGSGGATGASD